MSHITSALTRHGSWLLAGVMLYAVLLRATAQAHWALRAVGILLLLVLPFMAVNALLQTDLNTWWMFAPLILTAWVPKP